MEEMSASKKRKKLEAKKRMTCQVDTPNVKKLTNTLMISASNQRRGPHFSLHLVVISHDFRNLREKTQQQQQQQQQQQRKRGNKEQRREE
jgi:hypothetical protein